MLTVMSAIEVSPERISDDDAMELDVRLAMDMPMVELVPEVTYTTALILTRFCATCYHHVLRPLPPRHPPATRPLSRTVEPTP